MIAIAGGGTGGHIFPIIAVVQELKERGYQKFVWIGEKGGKEESWAERIDVPFIGVPSGKLRRYFSIRNFFDLFKILGGFVKSLIILKKYKIDILFSKGGFVSVPPVIAAWLRGIPVVTHESDITPGLANRINAKFSKLIFVSFEVTGQYFGKKNVAVTGNPIRREIKDGKPERGRKYLASFMDLSRDVPIVLVLGGSLGASSINRAVWEMAEKYELDFYLIHQCGPGNAEGKLISKTPHRYLQMEFIDREIGDVIKASDLVVSRAGAGAVYEIGYHGKPAIFIPLPKRSSRGEQIKNAGYLKQRNAAEVIEDEKLSGDILYKKIKELLMAPNLMKKMSMNIKTLIIKDAEKKIADEIERFLN